MNNEKKTFFSGVKPSGDLHLGNYLGAISSWVELQNAYNCIVCVVDYHAITVKQEPEKLKNNIIEIAKTYLAAGINPDKAIIFQQSDLSQHTELGWILNCIARISDLDKMTQFKDKAGNNQEKVSVGLYDYPVLMASDILLYNTDIVPVGDDQLQHVELTREIARRFNTRFGETFKIPEAQIRKNGARIMNLDNPDKKMSKSSDNINSYVALNDDPNKARKKIMKAVTDSDSEIRFDTNDKPAISNLLSIYSILGQEKIKNIEKKYKNSGYGEFKKDLATIVADFLNDFQNRYNKINDEEVKQILKSGAKQLEPIAQNTLNLVKEKIGIN